MLKKLCLRSNPELNIGQRGEKFTSPAAVKDYLRLKLAGYEHEVFAILMLDNQHRLIAYSEMFRGTIDSASIHPREIVKEVLAHNAAALIMAHNHPSGHPEPSAADRQITQRLKDALVLVEVRVLDHIVVGGLKTESFAELGYLRAQGGFAPLLLLLEGCGHFARPDFATKHKSVSVPSFKSVVE
tara:strand:- start:9880 stop:10434 length:555 start_codon:yes stop_codon:yes gene_type:complete